MFAVFLIGAAVSPVSAGTGRKTVPGTARFLPVHLCVEQVRTLTQGGQNPTGRRENLEYDFVVC